MVSRRSNLAIAQELHLVLPSDDHVSGGKLPLGMFSFASFTFSSPVLLKASLFLLFFSPSSFLLKSDFLVQAGLHLFVAGISVVSMSLSLSKSYQVKTVTGLQMYGTSLSLSPSPSLPLPLSRSSSSWPTQFSLLTSLRYLSAYNRTDSCRGSDGPVWEVDEGVQEDREYELDDAICMTFKVNKLI